MLARLGCVFVLGLISIGIFADPVLNVQGGQLMGATGVEVDGVLYDVEFVDNGSCVTLFSGCDEVSDFFFTEAQAGLASQALIDQIFQFTPYNTDPTSIFGCTHASTCYVVTPFMNSPPNQADVLRSVVRASFSEFVSTTSYSMTKFFSSLPKSVYAVWSVSAVPLPAAVWLFGSALVGLGMVGRRRKQHAAV